VTEVWLRHALLDELGVRHGFGTRSAPALPDVVRPQQVHGAVVCGVTRAGDPQPPAADAIVATAPSVSVGVITADCVPILAATADGRAVAAIHAGWRGLAAGVVERGLRRLSALSPDASLCAVVGPHIGSCCYEVDAPVLDALRGRFGDEALSRATSRSRPGHAMLALGRLIRGEFAALGMPTVTEGRVAGCTRCDARRFHSYRRDGARAGRLLHHVRPCA
jgi:YfiH family protein